MKKLLLIVAIATQLRGQPACTVNGIDIARCGYPHAATLVLPSGSTCRQIACPIPDRDGDGLNDAWEEHGGIDLDCDGRIDPARDLVLPDANPDRPDIYLTYDWMVAPDHSHKPHQQAIRAVVDAFARRGIALHVVSGHAIPHSSVITFSPVISPSCNGPDAVKLSDLKLRYFDSRRKLAYHYLVFGHYSECDSLEHCAQCVPMDGVPAVFGATGRAELPGNDFVVTTGAFLDALGTSPGFEQEAGLIAHELGHNLGTQHGGSDEENFKPNFLSAVNSNFTFTGIPVADQFGSTTPIACRNDRDCPAGAICASMSHVCTRIDYSSQQLATLAETSLDESFGIGAGTRDITTHNCPDGAPVFGAASGPIDWNCNGNASETAIAADVDANGEFGNVPGWADWSHLLMAFQCTANGSANSFPPELTIAEAMHKHILFARRAVKVREIGGGKVAILSEEDFDPSDIDPSSLKFGHFDWADINGDGKQDLILSPGSLRITGWLKNSQAFEARLP